MEKQRTKNHPTISASVYDVLEEELWHVEPIDMGAIIHIELPKGSKFDIRSSMI